MVLGVFLLSLLSVLKCVLIVLFGFFVVVVGVELVVVVSVWFSVFCVVFFLVVFFVVFSVLLVLFFGGVCSRLWVLLCIMLSRVFSGELGLDSLVVIVLVFWMLVIGCSFRLVSRLF